MRQAALFLLAGGVAAAANVVSRIAYSLVLSLPAAIVLAYLTGMLVAFALNRWFVFQTARDEVGRRMGRFFLVNLVAIAQTMVITLAVNWLLLRIGMTAMADTIAHAVGVAVPAFSSYVMHRRWTFSDKPFATRPSNE